MTEALALLTLAGAFLIAAMSPGPNFVVVTAHALAARRCGLWTACGLMCGSTTWAAATVLGLNLLLAQAPWLYDSVRIAGAAYLIYLGLKMLWGLRRNGTPPVEKVPEVSAATAWRRGYLTSLTNPKSAAFFASLFLATLPPQPAPWLLAAAVAVVCVLSAFWHFALALAFSHARVRALHARARRVIDAVVGATLVLLGARLLASR